MFENVLFITNIKYLKSLEKSLSIKVYLFVDNIISSLTITKDLIVIIKTKIRIMLSDTREIFQKI